MSTWRKVWALVAKDLAAERRSGELLTIMIVFGVMVLAILNFAFDLRVDNVFQVAPGALWVAIAFAGILGLNRSLAREHEDGGLEGLMLAPMDRSTIYLAKAAGNLAFMTASELVIMPLFTVLFGVNVMRVDLLLVVFLGTLGLAGVGTLFATMVGRTRARDVLLPVLLLPVSVPLLIAASKATAGLLDGVGMAGIGGWLRLLAGFDLVLITASYALFEYVLEA